MILPLISSLGEVDYRHAPRGNKAAREALDRDREETSVDGLNLEPISLQPLLTISARSKDYPLGLDAGLRYEAFTLPMGGLERAFGIFLGHDDSLA